MPSFECPGSSHVSPEHSPLPENIGKVRDEEIDGTSLPKFTSGASAGSSRSNKTFVSDQGQMSRLAYSRRQDQQIQSRIETARMYVVESDMQSVVLDVGTADGVVESGGSASRSRSRSVSTASQANTSGTSGSQGEKKSPPVIDGFDEVRRRSQPTQRSRHSHKKSRVDTATRKRVDRAREFLDAASGLDEVECSPTPAAPSSLHRVEKEASPELASPSLVASKTTSTAGTSDQVLAPASASTIANRSNDHRGIWSLCDQFRNLFWATSKAKPNSL
jgi:hypothetical protein